MQSWVGLQTRISPVADAHEDSGFMVLESWVAPAAPYCLRSWSSVVCFERVLQCPIHREPTQPVII